MRKPLQTLLIKPAGPDCNMACTYCFYLEKELLFPETRHHRMTEDVLEKVIRQAMRQSGDQISFIWQGGEPTLMGLEFYQKSIELQQHYGRGQAVGNGLQTNGLLIDDEWIAFLKSYNWLVGLSLDGPQHVHDRYRRALNGDGTWEQVTACAERMLAADLAVNALVVVNDYSVQFPDEIYRFHKNLGLSHMQFIPCVEADRKDPSGVLGFSVPAEEYGRFLCRLFDLWMDDFSGLEPTTSIRMFESLFYTYIGHIPPECTLLPECGTYVMVEHNGDVFSCDFYAEKHLCFGRRKLHLPDECNDCRWLHLCRGGCPKDRLQGPGPKVSNHLCSTYRMFFDHSDERFRRLADRWKEQFQHSNEQGEDPTGEQSADAKVGRNHPCPCGSGLKYKRCCGA